MASCVVAASCRLSNLCFTSQTSYYPALSVPHSGPSRKSWAWLGDAEKSSSFLARGPVCAQLPPEQGQGLNARKASAAGLQRRIKGGEGSLEGWIPVATSEDFSQGKNKAIIHNNRGYVLVKRDNDTHCLEANCTACKFPMIEGKVSQDDVVSIKCPLCHSKFSLVDGEVLKYCPKDGLLQWVVGLILQKSSPLNAKVFPARVSNSGRVYVKFV